MERAAIRLERKARCICGTEKTSSPNLPFFECCDAGSTEAVDHCRCGYHMVAHGKPLHPAFKVCDSFTPRGARAHDRFYCGCRGWD
jgi:hypothetical protein